MILCLLCLLLAAQGFLGLQKPSRPGAVAPKPNAHVFETPPAARTQTKQNMQKPNQTLAPITRFLDFLKLNTLGNRDRVWGLKHCINV